MGGNLLLEQYGRFKKAELEESPFRCLLNANIEINPHQINAFCAAIQALKTGGIVLADEVGLGKTIEAGLTLKYVLDSGAKHVLIALPATLRKQWEVELEEKFNLQASILDRLTVESNLSFWKACLENRDEVRIVITSYDYSSKLMQRFSNVKWDFIIIDEAHNLRNVFHGTKRAKRLYELSKGIPKILLTATPLQNSLSDLHGLISFIDPRIFGSEKVFNKRFIEGQDYTELKRELIPVLYRTLRRDVGKYMDFKKRECRTIDFVLSPDEVELYMRVNNFLKKDVLYSIPNANKGLIVLVIRKLLASSSYALIETFEVLKNRLQKLYEGTKSANAQDGFDLFWNFVEDEIDESGFEEIDDEDTLFQKQQIQAEIDEVDAIIETASRIQSNAKVKALKTAIHTAFEYQEKQNIPQKVVVFTESKRTQKYIASELRKDGFEEDDILLFNGDFNDAMTKEIYRAFQIAFILMNLSGIVNPEHKDRDVVDLLYFPTGGGKTEAYLGLMAFVIANRRLRASDASEYNADGGVTAMLRYTLRLLTTQQRDRITKMVVAAELIRQKTYPKYGKEPISIGFWVGGGVTPNKFDELVEKADKPGEARRKRNLLYKQLLTCPFCGKPLTEDEFYIDPDRKSVAIYCADRNCMFYKYKQDRIRIPVYLVDEEIYAKCPTIILSTVDKFARLPWDVKTNALFGRVDRVCSRDGYVAIGEEHKRHNRTQELPASTLTPIRPFLPPELIIQDELHLITGPLGTVYGAYETIIEDMCTYGDKRIKPKYVVSTATIKNASEQTRCLYARQSTAQFPPNGFEIGDSFFINEISTKDDPFRKYVGVCAPGQSVKTTLLRMYAIILQTSYQLAQQDEYKNVIDPYYSLVGYYNSIRELGGAVRLLQDDIPKRIYRIKTKYNMDKVRYLNKKVEITSRMSSYEIPNKLRQLEATCDSKDCLDTAVATNMIAVGMDVDRLGLMVVTGQPKQNSEYIQATSRIGRAFPGLVFTLYNPYRPRDLSHYENFTGYHSQLYRFVEGTTATPFSARARDRVMHALIISAIRLKYPEMASNERAADIAALSDIQMSEIKALILDRLNIVKPEVRLDAENEIDQFIDWWKMLAAQGKPLRYYVYGTDKYNRLMNYYGQSCKDTEKATLSSMREVENAANMFYYTEE